MVHINGKSKSKPSNRRFHREFISFQRVANHDEGSVRQLCCAKNAGRLRVESAEGVDEQNTTSLYVVAQIHVRQTYNR